MKSLLGTLMLLALALLRPGDLFADSYTAAGLTFSDELGGFRLLSVSGTGTLADPIIVVEEITRVGAAILTVRGSQIRESTGPSILPAPIINLAVVKIVINGSRRVWTGFDMELQTVANRPSPYEDGLSFDQMGSFDGAPFRSDSFADARRISEPYDRVRFASGSVDPGKAGRFTLYITDPTPKAEFFLLQEPLLLLAGPSDPPQPWAGDLRRQSARRP